MALKKVLSNKLLEVVLDQHKTAENFQRPYYQKFAEYYSLYRGVFDSSRQNYTGRANLFVPYIFSTIETVHPRITASKPKILVLPREQSDYPKADAVGAMLDYRWQTMDMQEKLKMVVKQMLIYGVGVLKLYWDFKGERDDVERDEPCADIVDLYDFFLDPNAHCIEDASYVVHKSIRTLEYIKNAGIYENLQKLKDEEIQQTSEYKTERDSTLGLSRPKKKGIELLEYWGKADLGDGEQEAVITVANKTTVIRAVPNPYNHQKKPFISFHDNPMPLEFWSLGEVEPLRSLQYELNDVRNQRMDNVTSILHKMWKVSNNADVDESELVWRPGGVVHVNDMTGVEPLEVTDVTGSSYNEETLIKGDIQQTSGISDYTAGQGNQSKALANDTATGIALLQEAGSVRLKTKLENVENGIKKFGEMLLSLEQQYTDQALVIRVVGDRGNVWREIKPEELRGKFDLRVESGSTQPMNKQIQRAEARELLNTIVPFAQLGVNIGYFIRHLISTYDLPNPDEAFSQQGQPSLLGAAGTPADTGGIAIPGVANSPIATGVPNAGLAGGIGGLRP